jgi:hypothetical protein
MSLSLGALVDYDTILVSIYVSLGGVELTHLAPLARLSPAQARTYAAQLEQGAAEVEAMRARPPSPEDDPFPFLRSIGEQAIKATATGVHLSASRFVNLTPEDARAYATALREASGDVEQLRRRRAAEGTDT